MSERFRPPHDQEPGLPTVSAERRLERSLSQDILTEIREIIERNGHIEPTGSLLSLAEAEIETGGVPDASTLEILEGGIKAFPLLHNYWARFILIKARSGQDVSDELSIIIDRYASDPGRMPFTISHRFTKYWENLARASHAQPQERPEVTRYLLAQAERCLSEPEDYSPTQPSALDWAELATLLGSFGGEYAPLMETAYTWTIGWLKNEQPKQPTSLQAKAELNRFLAAQGKRPPFKAPYIADPTLNQLLALTRLAASRGHNPQYFENRVIKKADQETALHGIPADHHMYEDLALAWVEYGDLQRARVVADHVSSPVLKVSVLSKIAAAAYKTELAAVKKLPIPAAPPATTTESLPVPVAQPIKEFSEDEIALAERELHEYIARYRREDYGDDTAKQSVTS